jgi:hypothetical protein
MTCCHRHPQSIGGQVDIPEFQLWAIVRVRTCTAGAKRMCSLVIPHCSDPRAASPISYWDQRELRQTMLTELETCPAGELVLAGWCSGWCWRAHPHPSTIFS